MKADRPLAVDSFEEDRIAVFIHGEASGQTGHTGKFAQGGHAELGDGGLLSDEVAESKEVEAEHVARTGIDRSQQASRAERARQRKSGAFRHFQVAGNLSDTKAPGAGIAHEIEQRRGPSHRLHFVTLILISYVRQRNTQYGLADISWSSSGRRPSSCGKTTALRILAGLGDFTSGSLSIGGYVVNNVLPKDRGVATVFQNDALYPHMMVGQNMGFALKIRGPSKPESAKKVGEAAAILRLTEYLDRRPKALSGGQRNAWRWEGLSSAVHRRS